MLFYILMKSKNGILIRNNLQKTQKNCLDLQFNSVCDGTTTVDQPCDELCGGAGCDKCGGLSCLNGALSKAKEAVKAANNADALLIEKDGQAEDGNSISKSNC